MTASNESPRAVKISHDDFRKICDVVAAAETSVVVSESRFFEVLRLLDVLHGSLNPGEPVPALACPLCKDSFEAVA